MKQIISILIIEDDIVACNELKECINRQDDLKLAGITNNSTDALQLVTATIPNVILLDLELHHGGGNGLLFLHQLKKLQLQNPPYILVTTHNMSDATLEQARELGADFILTKYEDGYNAQYVIDNIHIMHNAIVRKNTTVAPLVAMSPNEEENLLLKRIYREFDLIGINPRSIGYKYLADAVLLCIQGTRSNLARALTTKYKKSEKSIERAMQNTIKLTWDTGDIEELYQYYTAKIRSDRGSPTLMEFVCYYATKVTHDFSEI